MTRKQIVLEKFLRYVRINTQSKEDAVLFPSTDVQLDLAQLLVQELRDMGVNDAAVDEHGYVLGTIPATTGAQAPVIGLIAHMDTSPEVPGENVKPHIIEEYQGGDIAVNAGLNVSIRVSENPELNQCIGHTLVTSDGTTLLGADDKAGVAAIMTAAGEILADPAIPHGTVRIAFTPDEEVGEGVKFFDCKKFGADYAYTVDGGFPGEINRETFSADAAAIEIEGRDIHPGTAKDIMVNAIRVASAIIARMPRDMAPETTEGYEPYIHPLHLQGTVFKATIKLILRDFKTEGLNTQKKILEDIIAEAREQYPKALIKLDISETYRNMREELEKYPDVTGRLWNACLKAGVQPEWKPIRGGTDGSRLTAMGLPTPNMFTGSCNHHSRNEWLSADALAKAVEVLLNLVKY